jgi:hypothetical protein
MVGMNSSLFSLNQEKNRHHGSTLAFAQSLLTIAHCFLFR